MTHQDNDNDVMSLSSVTLLHSPHRQPPRLVTNLLLFTLKCLIYEDGTPNPALLATRANTRVFIHSQEPLRNKSRVLSDDDVATTTENPLLCCNMDVICEQPIHCCMKAVDIGALMQCQLFMCYEPCLDYHLFPLSLLKTILDK